MLRINPSLVGSQMSSDVSSDQSSVCDGAGYDEVFGSGYKSRSFSELLERETSAQSPNEEVGSYGDEGQEEVGGKKGEVEVERSEERRVGKECVP